MIKCILNIQRVSVNMKTHHAKQLISMKKRKPEHKVGKQKQFSYYRTYFKI